MLGPKLHTSARMDTFKEFRKKAGKMLTPNAKRLSPQEQAGASEIRDSIQSNLYRLSNQINKLTLQVDHVGLGPGLG